MRRVIVWILLEESNSQNNLEAVLSRNFGVTSSQNYQIILMNQHLLSLKFVKLNMTKNLLALKVGEPSMLVLFALLFLFYDID